ncbi:DUF1413 domain-containing protein [Paludicola sp. MB14-C6]|uniref:DUF1413 domain-containing protein n=1 Tax=Paludihabitans sp. MB14-C6 TaxID=3070656 RepID=UPI0027DBAD55|nr:DUF1413 domain-containing protein [Paludicola sp. MB14-C6]WMJ22898.1 DUF1413 domain-containing protein [Paludicola sp. MB14-C6]
MIITANTDLQTLLTYALTYLTDVETDETFIVKDLFRGFEWHRIFVGNRTKLGSMFFTYAQNQGAHLMTPLGKTPQNQQIYKKL